jgi:hypothetical protein
MRAPCCVQAAVVKSYMPSEPTLEAGLTSKRQQQLAGLDMPGRFYFSQQQPNPLIIVQCLGRQQLTPLLFT